MKQIVSFFVVLLLLTSCRALKPVVATAGPEPAKTNTSSPAFIENISSATVTQKPLALTPDPNQPDVSMDRKALASMEPITKAGIDENAAIEKSHTLQFKYSILLNVPVEKITNYRLLAFIEDWYGTRYVYGGSTRRGIDCSAFSGTLMASVFGKTLPRIAQDQFLYSERVSRTRLQEGDLVFFNTRGGISHVGVYLSNNKFVHASSSNGVVISDLSDPYYSKRFIAAGRVLSPGITAASGF